MFYDYADSGAWTESTCRANADDFSRIRLRQRVAVNTADQPLVAISYPSGTVTRDQIVNDGPAVFTTTHAIDKPGAKTLKVWAIDPGLVVQKLVVNLGGLKPTYLGPPESPRL